MERSLDVLLDAEDEGVSHGRCTHCANAEGSRTSRHPIEMPKEEESKHVGHAWSQPATPPRKGTVSLFYSFLASKGRQKRKRETKKRKKKVSLSFGETPKKMKLPCHPFLCREHRIVLGFPKSTLG